MANKIESKIIGNCVKITKMVSTDREIVVPDTLDGRPVTSLGDRFLAGSPSTDNRVLTIPASVTSFGKDFLSGMTRISRIDYLGEFTTLSNAGITAEFDCTVTAMHDGRMISFDFLSGFPMSFPGFDRELLAASFRISPEIAMKRLSVPVLLDEDSRKGYETYMLRRIMPMAERAVTGNDPKALSDLYSTGLLGTEELRTLLETSVRSGKTSMTSVIMGMIRSNCSEL